MAPYNRIEGDVIRQLYLRTSSASMYESRNSYIVCEAVCHRTDDMNEQPRKTQKRGGKISALATEIQRVG